jgi:hypothetical protein
MFSLVASHLYAQKKTQKQHRYFGEYIMADSSSTLMIPVLYDLPVFTSDKMASSGQYFSNFIFYNFKTDNAKRLFEKDVYISSYQYAYYASEYHRREQAFYIVGNTIFYKAYTTDHNKDGKIDWLDPCTLYVSDKQGNNLQALTTENQNVVGVTVYDKQGFVMIKIQLDADLDGVFETDTDKDFYLVKLDLKTRQFGPKIGL